VKIENLGAIAGMTMRPMQQIPGVYHRRLGDIDIVALRDGLLSRDHTMMRGVPADEAQRHLAEAFRDAFVLSVNAFLVATKDRMEAWQQVL